MDKEAELTWSSALAVGNSTLDDEHRSLIRAMHDLREANHKSLSKPELLKKFDSLAKITEEHFKDEELHMERMKYPDLERHKKIHQQLFVTLGKYRQEFTGSVYGRFPTAVFDFFNTWLVTHIMIVDQQYAKYEHSLNQSTNQKKQK